DYGDYQIIMSAVQTDTDQVPDNNVDKLLFSVNDSIYSRSDYDKETNTSTAGWGNNDGDIMAVAYQINEACEANSISVFISLREENPAASTQPGMEFMYWIYYYDLDEEAWVELISTELMEVTEEMLNTWVTLPLEKDGEMEFLEPGVYRVCIQEWHLGGPGADNNQFRFTIGQDNDTYCPTNASLHLAFGADTWYNNNSTLPMIRLNLNNSGGPTVAPVSFNCDMNEAIAGTNFNPASDYVDIIGDFNDWAGSEHLTDADGDGIYTTTIPDLTYQSNIEYKYRINGTTSELTSRMHRIGYWNVLDDIYDLKVGVDVIPGLTTEVIIYPNPASDMLNITVNNKTNQDLDISISNIQGQVVYQNHVNSVISHQEKVDISRFSKGIYFLKVNKTVNKVIVQ
ncbi:T9SS type A sorting domain-containing protein, partial [Bacteroidota bacterium]